MITNSAMNAILMIYILALTDIRFNMILLLPESEVNASMSKKNNHQAASQPKRDAPVCLQFVPTAAICRENTADTSIRPSDDNVLIAQVRVSLR